MEKQIEKRFGEFRRLIQDQYGANTPRIPEEIQQPLQRLLGRLWDDATTLYSSATPEARRRHIFNDIAELTGYLTGCPKLPEEYLEDYYDYLESLPIDSLEPAGPDSDNDILW